MRAPGTDGSLFDDSAQLVDANLPGEIVAPFTTSSDLLRLVSLTSVRTASRSAAESTDESVITPEPLLRDAVESLFSLPVAPPAMFAPHTTVVSGLRAAPDADHRESAVGPVKEEPAKDMARRWRWATDPRGSHAHRTLDEMPAPVAGGVGAVLNQLRISVRIRPSSVGPISRWFSPR